MNLNTKIFVLLFLFLTLEGYSQKVGLVLSGGGSRGVAHIGVIRALEENNIPIDYITGTSIGAVIGGLYASGFTVNEIDSLVCSEDFQRWADGVVDPKYDFYFKQQELDASWISVKLNYDSVWQYKLPTNVVSPVALDFAFMEFFSGANFVCKKNFDSLFVPFRCVAADISANKQIVFKNGDLTDAIRASMTYPFYFKPIRVNGKLLFDGGLYNNFPVDVMYNDFFPDIIIGSSVTANSDPPNEDNIMSQIENMLMSKSNFSIMCDAGFLIEPNIESVGLTNFRRSKEFIDSGYYAANRIIPSILPSINRKITPIDLEQKRQNYKKKLPNFLVDKIQVSGLNKSQTIYVNRLLAKHKGKKITSSLFKIEYFKLLTDDKFEQIYPKSVFNTSSGFYDLSLNIKRDKNLLLQFGGNISSNPVNEAYVELRYKHLSSRALSVLSNFYFGRFYNAIQVKGRIDEPTRLPFYFETAFNFNQWNYFKSSTSFFGDITPSYLVESENFWKSTIGIPYGNTAKIEAGIGAANLRHSYYQTNYFSRIDISDKSIYNFYYNHILFEKSTLNRKQFPSLGKYFLIYINYNKGNERDLPGTTAINRDVTRKFHEWVAGKISFDDYLNISKFFKLGLSCELAYSTQKFSNNYTATMLIAPSYNPIPESKTLFLMNFAAHHYAAAGMRSVLSPTKRIDIRLEAFVFQPYKKILFTKENQAYYGTPFLHRNYIGCTTAVYHSPIGPISFSYNFFDEPDKKGSFVFNIGYLIFNKKASLM